MKKTFTLLALMFLLITNCFIAQTSGISGTVVEKASLQSLPGSIIMVFKNNDTIPISSTTTDGNGFFQINGLMSGTYITEIQFIGYYSKKMTVQLNDTIKSLDSLVLNPSSLLLGAVNVTAEQDLMTYNLDRKVYNVAQDIFSDSYSASEIMQNIPSVSVDVNGAISLRGSNNITFFINGKPSAMLRRNAAAVLAGLPASSIERIEIITSPSAKYRPDGIGGIINIVLKKDAKIGFNGQVTANIGTEYRSNANVNLNYGKDKANYFLNYAYRHSAGKYLFTDSRIYKNDSTNLFQSTYMEDGYSLSNGNSHNIFAGANFELNRRNNLEVSGTWFTQQNYNKSSADIRLSDSLGLPATQFINNQNNDEFESEAEINIAFEHVFKKNKEHTLNIEAAVSQFEEDEKKTLHQLYSIPITESQQRNILVHKSGYQQEYILEYAVPLGEDIELEAGYNGEFVYQDMNYTNSGINSRFLFNQDLHAGYALYSQSIEDFGFKLGLRAEQTNIRSRLKVPYETDTHNDYFKLFPTANIELEIDEAQTLSLGYSKRLNRPDADELNPNLEYSDPRNAESGNPLLKPEQVQSFELGHQIKRKKISLTSTLYYRYTYDAIASIQTRVGDSLVLSSLSNINNQQFTGLEIVASRNSRKINFNLTGNVYYTSLNVSSNTTNPSAISGNIKANATWRLSKSTAFQFNAFYYFPEITPQGKTFAFYYFNAGFKQQLFKDRASVSITGTDIFYTYKITKNINSPSLEQTSTNRRRMPVIYIGFTWKLKNYNQQKELDFETGGFKK